MAVFSVHAHMHRLRLVIGCLLAVLLLCNLAFRSPEQKSTWTTADSLVVANYIGDASFALTGSLAAGTQGMDLFGCVLIGVITALGGGSFRDLVLGKTPLWWLVHWEEVSLCVIIGAVTFLMWPFASRRLQLTSSDEWLFWTDTLGLAVFAANGAYVGSTVSKPPLHLLACAGCGMFTATFGGLTRDVLIGCPPRILYSHMELYALPAFMGGCDARRTHVPPHVSCPSWFGRLATTISLRISSWLAMDAVLFGAWVVVLARILALNHGLRLPVFPASSAVSEAARPRNMAVSIARLEELRLDAASRGVRQSLLTGIVRT